MTSSLPRILPFAPTTLLILFDRLTKLWALHALSLGHPQPLIGNTIRLTRVHNIGGAFGIFPGSGTLFIVVSAIIAIVITGLLLSKRAESWLLRLGLSIVLAGAVGNLIDRVFYGYVLDFFEIRGFPVFNLADSCVTVGAILIIIYVLFGGDRDRSTRQADHA